jgi:uncharacterized protein YqeY
MNMRETLALAVKTAMKTQDKLVLSTLRMVQAAIHDRDIVQRGAGKDPVNDDELVTLLRKMVKQREDSVAMYETGGRQELADKEKQEIAIISGFLPQQMSPEEVMEACKTVIAELGAATPGGITLRDMGKCMAVLKERYPGRMDFTVASAAVKSLLQ